MFFSRLSQTGSFIRTGALGVLLTGASLMGCQLREMPPSENDDSGVKNQGSDAPPGVLRPIEDVEVKGFLGKGDTDLLVRDVDDGIKFEQADDEDTMVYTEDGAPEAKHMLGYYLGQEVTIGTVVVNYRASKGSGEGTIAIALFDGSKKIVSSEPRNLGDTWRNYQERFENLTISNPDNLRTEVTMKNLLGMGVLRYTQIWIELEPK